MDRRRILAGLLLALTAGTASVAGAQPAQLQDTIVGTWALISLRATQAGGATSAPYGPHATGTMWFDHNRRFGIILINPDIPKYASNNRETPTPAEAMAVATGSDALFGSYAVDNARRIVTLHVEASSYPNVVGTDQTRVVKLISETDLVLVDPASPNGGAVAELVLRRLE